MAGNIWKRMEMAKIAGNGGSLKFLSVFLMILGTRYIFALCDFFIIATIRTHLKI